MAKKIFLEHEVPVAWTMMKLVICYKAQRANCILFNNLTRLYVWNYGYVLVVSFSKHLRNSIPPAFRPSVLHQMSSVTQTSQFYGVCRIPLTRREGHSTRFARSWPLCESRWKSALRTECRAFYFRYLYLVYESNQVARLLWAQNWRLQDGMMLMQYTSKCAKV